MGTQWISRKLILKGYLSSQMSPVQGCSAGVGWRDGMAQTGGSSRAPPNSTLLLLWESELWPTGQFQWEYVISKKSSVFLCFCAFSICSGKRHGHMNLRRERGCFGCFLKSLESTIVMIMWRGKKPNPVPVFQLFSFTPLVTTTRLSSGRH